MGIVSPVKNYCGAKNGCQHQTLNTFGEAITLATSTKMSPLTDEEIVPASAKERQRETPDRQSVCFAANNLERAWMK
jgi:hypothetical protein